MKSSPTILTSKPVLVKVGKLFMPTTDIGVCRGLRHLAAMLRALTVIGHLIETHGQLPAYRQAAISVLAIGAMPAGKAAPTPKD